MVKRFLCTVLVLTSLLPAVVRAGEVVINIRTIAINEVYDPLASSKGVFVRRLPVQPSPAVANLEKRAGFVLLEPQDARLAVPRPSAEPELIVDGLRFVVPYALIGLGQRLFIKNKTAYDLTFHVQFDGHGEDVKVPAGKRVAVSIVGTKDGMVKCLEFPHLKAFVFRAEPGYLLRLSDVKEGDNKIISKSIIDGPYKMRIWIGRWWETQPVMIEGDRTVIRVDIDGTSKSKTVEAIVNPPDETILAEPKAVKQQPSQPVPVERPIVGTPPAPPVKETPKPQAKPKPVRATKPKPAKASKPKPAKPAQAAPKPKPTPKPSKAVKQTKTKPAAKPSKPAGGFKIKKVVEEKKPKPKPKAKEKKKPAGGGFFKIKKIEGE